MEELVAPDELPPAAAYTTELVPSEPDPDAGAEPLDEPDDPAEPPDEPDAAVLPLVDDPAVLDELPAEATSLPELLPLAAGSAAEDDPPVEPELGPPTTASSPPPEPSLPTRTGIAISVGLRPGAARAVRISAGSVQRHQSARCPA